MAMSDTQKRRPAGRRALVRKFGPEFGPGYHAAKLSMYDAIAKHFKLMCDRYGPVAAQDYLRDGLTLAEADALHVVRQQREMQDLAAAHEARVAELVAQHEAHDDKMITELQTWLAANYRPPPQTWRERIAAAVDALFGR